MNPKNKSYKFTSTNVKSIYEDFSENANINKKQSQFFQICAFKNPKTQKFHGRKFVIHEANFSDITNILLNDDQYKNLLNNLSDNEFKCYSTYALDNISYPNLSDILISQSDLLINNDYDTFQGFAPFK